MRVRQRKAGNAHLLPHSLIKMQLFFNLNYLTPIQQMELQIENFSWEKYGRKLVPGGGGWDCRENGGRISKVASQAAFVIVGGIQLLFQFSVLK